MTFLDTNIVVYANDGRDERKQNRALELMERHIVDRTGVISSQVLSEYASVALAKLGQSHAVVTHQLHLLESLRVILIDAGVIRRAIDIQQLYRMSFWDSQILAAAERAGCDEIVSEDLSNGQFYLGMECRNPFER